MSTLIENGLKLFKNVSLKFMTKTLKIEDLPKPLQRKIAEEAEFKAALDYFCESEVSFHDQIAALKAVAKINPDLDANEICSLVENYDHYTVGNLLKEIELSKLGHIRNFLWAINLVKA